MIAPRSPRRAPLATSYLALGLLLMSPVVAQKSTANIEAELAFARGLASKWSFVDLAEDVIRDVSSGRLESDQQASLALLRCEIYTVGARNERDPAKRNELFEQALSCLDGYINENSRAANLGDAEEAFVSASQLYARSLEIALDDAIGEEAKALTDKRIEVLENGVKRTESLISSISAIPEEDRTEKQSAQRFELMLSRGQMHATINSAKGGDDPLYRDLAIKGLENLAFEAGMGTPFALRAYTALGEVYAGGRDFETAASYFDSVADQCIPFAASDREDLLEWSKLPAPMKQRRFLFVELSMPGILNAYLNYGDDAMARERSMFFWNLRQSEAFDLSQFGYDALIQVARVMLNSDGYIGGDVSAGTAEWFATEEEMTAKYRQRRLQMTTTDFALQIVNQVAQDAPSNAQKTAAGKLIAEMSEKPGVTISADQMFKAATAKARDKDYVGARKAIQDLLGRLDELEAAQRVDFGAKTYNLLGDVLRFEGRELEAAMAYREGAVNWSDPEFDELNAKGFQFMVTRIAKAAGDDPVMKALVAEAEDVVTAKGPALQGQAVQFNRGKKAQDAKKWADAIEAYKQLGEDADDYEVAYVNIAVCMFRNGQVKDAIERFDTYLKEVREDPNRRTESPGLLARRKGASATAEFYRGYIQHLIADKQAEKGDTSGYAKVIQLLDGFANRYSDQPSLCAIALNRIVDSHAKLGHIAEAQAALDSMLAEFPDDENSGAAAMAVYKMYEAQRDRQVADGADRAAVIESERAMASALHTGNRINASPKWDVLIGEAGLWFGIESWSEAKAAYARVIQRFGDDAARRKSIEQTVAPNLGYCMLQLREVNDAKDFLSPFAMSGTPTKRTVQYFGMAVTGWLEGGKAGVSEVPGAGGTEEEFQFITDKLTSIQKVGQSWTSCEWYEDKLAEMYAFYSWGHTDPRRKDTAKNMIEGTQPFLEPANDTTFAIVDQFCTEDEDTPPELKARLGEGTLRARYQWLWSKTR
ncbi:MAG: tetratricopeptide repeat protein [Planctomycetota bacterium]